tara:strand:- start:457 stop:1659 length:1203 start_codon:yes stop_codon:yes gene_type:complete
VPCLETIAKLDLPTKVMLDVGGHFEEPLSVELICMPSNPRGLGDDITNLPGNTFLLGRTGSWGLQKPFSGLHARTVYDNIIPMFSVLLEYLNEDEVRQTNVLVASRSEDKVSKNAYLNYFHFLESEPIFLEDLKVPVQFGSLFFGVSGMGYFSSFRHKSSLGKRDRKELDKTFWLKTLGSGMFEHSGLVVPVSDFYMHFQAYQVYRNFMYELYEISLRRVRGFHKILIIDRPGLDREWPFEVDSLKQELAHRIPDSEILVYDYADKTLKEQATTTSWADVFLSVQGSGTVNRIFLQNEALSILFYPNSKCYHQSDHVERMVHWSHYVNYTFSSNMSVASEDLSCGIYGQPCCRTATAVAPDIVADIIISEMQKERNCVKGYCCTFGEGSDDCKNPTGTNT